MTRNHYAYFLTVTGLTTQDDKAKLEKMLREEMYFGGYLTFSFTQDNELVFDLDSVGGCITEIDRDEIESTLFTFCYAFPKAQFHVYAEDVDDITNSYEVQTYFDPKIHDVQYQCAEMVSYMTSLSQPIPYLEYTNGAQPRKQQYDLLNNTDFDLLYKQKSALLTALTSHGFVPNDILEGLINFLDYVGDWAEAEGKFVYPEIEKQPAVQYVHFNVQGKKCKELAQRIAYWDGSELELCGTSDFKVRGFRIDSNGTVTIPSDYPAEATERLLQMLYDYGFRGEVENTSSCHSPQNSGSSLDAMLAKAQAKQGRGDVPCAESFKEQDR